MGQLDRRKILVVLFAVGAIGVIGWLYFSARQEPAPSAEAKKLQDELAGVNQRIEEWKKIIAQQGEAPLAGPSKGPDPKPTILETIAVAKARLAAVRQRGSSVLATLDRLEGEASAWQSRMQTLLSGDPGKRLAGSKAHVEQFVALQSKKRLSLEAIRSLRGQPKLLLEPAQAAEQDLAQVFLPSDRFTAELDHLEQSAQGAHADYEQDRMMLDALLADAAGRTPAKKTMAQAVAEHHAEEGRARATAIAQAKKAARELGTKQLADAEAAAEKERNRLALERLALEVASEKFHREQELAKLRAAQERRKLEARFEAVWPELKELLKPLLSDGYAQPTRSGFERTTTRGPVSLAALKSAGLLDKDITALMRFYSSIGGHTHNDRPRGGFPQYSHDAKARARQQPIVQRAQDWLNEFGPLMVEKKLLAP
jgi:hypothetical protein